VEARTELGLSLFRLSQLTGLTVQALQQYETGKNWPSPKRMFLLAYLFKKAPDVLWPDLERDAVMREFGLSV
jgi:transcriptional regulator with XRE-family HTH domain